MNILTSDIGNPERVQTTGPRNTCSISVGTSAAIEDIRPQQRKESQEQTNQYVRGYLRYLKKSQDQANESLKELVQQQTQLDKNLNERFEDLHVRAVVPLHVSNPDEPDAIQELADSLNVMKAFNEANAQIFDDNINNARQKLGDDFAGYHDGIETSVKKHEQTAGDIAQDLAGNFEVTKTVRDSTGTQRMENKMRSLKIKDLTREITTEAEIIRNNQANSLVRECLGRNEAKAISAMVHPRNLKVFSSQDDKNEPGDRYNAYCEASPSLDSDTGPKAASIKALGDMGTAKNVTKKSAMSAPLSEKYQKLPAALDFPASYLDFYSWCIEAPGFVHITFPQYVTDCKGRPLPPQACTDLEARIVTFLREDVLPDLKILDFWWSFSFPNLGAKNGQLKLKELNFEQFFAPSTAVMLVRDDDLKEEKKYEEIVFIADEVTAFLKIHYGLRLGLVKLPRS